MERQKEFARTVFSVGTIAEALKKLGELEATALAKAQAEHETSMRNQSVKYPYNGRAGYYPSLRIARGNESWSFDTVDEWYAEYERGCDSARLSYSGQFYGLVLSYSGKWQMQTTVSVTAQANSDLATLMGVFSLAEPDAKVSEPPVPQQETPPVVVFLGHGGSGDWREVKDHLQDQHHYKIEAYEVGARAGHSIRDVLSSMMQSSSFALLIMSGEDETASGDTRARQNVVHEAGLFQGRLGFNKAIAVVENGVEVFSNLDGVQQIRYDKGNIKSTFGDILATLRREFGDRR